MDHVTFDMLMTVCMKVAVFWDVMLLILVHMYECFEELSVFIFILEEGRWRYYVAVTCMSVCGITFHHYWTAL